MSDTFTLSVHPTVPMNRPPCALYSRDGSNLASFGDSEKKTLRIVVEDSVFPITDLINPKDLRLAFKDIIKCHQWLVTVAKIIHRDISVNNLMYCQRNDEKYGVLKDFDLACPPEEDWRTTYKQRTGTMAFMAIDVLKPDGLPKDIWKHFAWYNLESTVYIFAWIIHRYKDGREVRYPPFEDWHQDTWESARAKSSWIHCPRLPAPTPQYASLAPVLMALKKVLRQGLDEQSRHENLLLIDPEPSNPESFEEDTSNGYVTYTTILDAFDRPPPCAESPDLATPE
ncbi:hypothetical protein L218DRAFT_960856 [Marasmius fiardii PR-910]|nr:hypothetical protein L218DRAFT_960856 [Marasmius fiardii PR-910]